MLSDASAFAELSELASCSPRDSASPSDDDAAELAEESTPDGLLDDAFDELLEAVEDEALDALLEAPLDDELDGSGVPALPCSFMYEALSVLVAAQKPSKYAFIAEASPAAIEDLSA